MAELKQVEEDYLSLWCYMEQENSLGNITKQTLSDQCDVVGFEFVAKVLAILSEVEFKSSAWCFVHNRQCPLSPRSPDSQVVLVPLTTPLYSTSPNFLVKGRSSTVTAKQCCTKLPGGVFKELCS